MKAVVGIDVGGSTTKIVGFDISDNKRTLLKPVTVKATDPVASVYGAFGKFTSENGVDIKDIKRVMLTGVGSTYIGDNIFGVPRSYTQKAVPNPNISAVRASAAAHSSVFRKRRSAWRM